MDLQHFYPRSPCGERHSSVNTADQEARFLSTLSLRRATYIRSNIPNFTSISIHALLAESDANGGGLSNSSINFYPRSPCGERPCKVRMSMGEVPFLSTLSLRRATRGKFLKRKFNHHFYPRSPCGERRHIKYDIYWIGLFLSTLSLRRATPDRDNGRILSAFLSTLSLRRATVLGIQHRVGEYISIHALLAESDHYDNYNLHCVEISIHALLAESDAGLCFSFFDVSLFLSTLSLRRATY